MFIKIRSILNIFIIVMALGLFSACSDGFFIPPNSGDTGGDGGNGDGGDTGGNGDGGDTGGDGDGGDTGGDGVAGVVDIFKPFDNNLYFGRTHLNIDEQKAYDLALKTMLDNYSSIVNDDGTGGRVKIDLAKHKILNIKNSKQLLKIVSFITQDESRLFHISSTVPRPKPSGSGHYTTDSNGNITEFYIRIHRVYIDYNKYRDEINTIEVNVKAILDSIGDLSKMSKPQIIRVLHEKYLATVAYGGMSFASAGDIRGSFLAPTPTDHYQRYLVICEGYSRSMLYLLQRLGFKNIYIVGMTNNGFHAWNKVDIDGKWYNLDSTWDDTMILNSPDSSKNHFLKSDAEFSIIHTQPQIDSEGKNTGYLSHGVQMPASANKSLTPSEYQ